MRNPKLSVAYDRYIRDTFNDLVKDKKLFKGFTDSGYRKYSPYTLENIVKEMTKKLRGGEGFDYGPGSIRSAYAKRFKNIKEIQKARDRIVTDKEMDAIREESSDKLVNLLDELRPSYKFDGDSFGYMDDASSAIAEGSRGLREAFDLTPEMRVKVDEYIDYLRKLPTEYFEAKMQRAVDLSEFTAAVVPKGTEQKLVDTLEGKGVAVSYYKKGDDADRLSAVQKAGAKQDILFRKSPAKGPTSPESITESIQPILDTWKAHPRVEVVKSVDELPGPLIDIIQRKTDGEIDGVFYNDRVYLIADNISSVAQAEKTILHETLGHWGTRKTFGRSFDRFLRSVMKDAKKGDIEAISKAYGLDLTKPLDRLEAADEYVARIAESGKDAATWAKLTSYVKQWLIKHGFTVKLSDNEIRAIVKRGVDARGKSRYNDNVTFRRGPGDKTTEATPQPDSGNEWLHREAIKYDSVEKFVEAQMEPPSGFFRSIRLPIPSFRGGATKTKIRRVLGKLESGKGDLAFNKEILRFNSPKELSENMYYHGSGGGIGGLKASITRSSREAETSGGGGYGERYWGISLSKDRNTASIFTAQSRYGSVAPVILRKGANVKVMPEIEDAVEIEDHIEELWDAGVDAVKIGNWEKESSEKELVVLNPHAIIVGKSESFPVYQKPKMPSFDEAKIGEMYENAHSEYSKLYKEARQRRKESFIAKYGREPGQSNFRKKQLDEYIKTKAHLTDIWNKAHEKVAPGDFSESLIAEAKKYKTADEFVAGQGVVYKGMPKTDWRTGKEITKIDATKTGKLGAGYFTTDRNVAQRFSDTLTKKDMSHVVEARVQIDNPFVIDAKGHPASEFMADADLLERPDLNNAELVNAVKSEKYDGVIIKNTADEGTIYLPKKASQIKTKAQLTDIWNKAHQSPKPSRSPEGGDQARFRKSPTKGPTTPESITKTIQPILDTWKAHPRVEVVKSVDELPGPLIDIIQRKTDGEIDGVFYNDRVYLIADNISSVAQAEKTILHETLGHWGTRKTFGRSFDRFLRSVMKDAKKGDIEAISKAYGLDLTKPLDRLEAADEYVARIAESGKDAATWAKLTSYVKQWLIKHGFTVKLSDNEIRAIVKRGVEAKEGKQVDDNIRFMKRRKPAPRKTLTTYKMFRTLKGRPGELFPLFIGKTESIPMNEWMDSEYIPTKGFAQRPGWHVGRKPRADHLMKKDGTMAEDRVWAEVEISADKDWQDVADQNKTRDIPGQVPADGFYKFKRPSNQGGEWLIAGSMRVNRTLTADDVEAINTEDAYQARFRKVKESDGRKIKTLYHGSKVGLYGEKIEGGLGSGNIYGGVFASTSESKARVHGDIVYKTDIPENDILTISNIRNDIEPKILKKALKENLPYSTPKQLNTAYEIVIEEESEYGDKYDEADLLDIFSSSDIGEAGWEAQRLRGLVAKSLGYKAVEVSDEYGTSYLILPGVKTEKLPTEDAYQARFHKIADLAKAGDVEGVRAESKKSYDEMMTPTDGNPLDAGAIAYLKSGDIETYFDHMPWIGELKPNEILKHDSSTGKLIATITGKDGKLRPSIRQSGFFAIKEFQDYFEQPHIKDISKTEWSKADAYRLFQAIDNGIFGGPAAKNIQWANQKTSMAKLLYSDQYKTKLADIQDKYLKTKKENELAGDISEFVSTELADVDAEEVYDIPKVKSFLKTAKEGRALDIIRAAQETRTMWDSLISEVYDIPKVKSFLKTAKEGRALDIIRAAQEIRTMWDSLISEQNRARKLRKQDEIGYLENYRPWVMKSNIFKRLMGIKAKPGHITDQPEMPDFIQPNKPFNPREIERTGGLESYSKERDIIKLMSDYIDTASKDIFDTNIIHSNKIYAATLRNIGHSNSAEAIERLTAEVFAGVSPRLTKVFRETAGLSTIRKPILSIRRALMRAVFPFNWTWNMFIQTSSAGLTFSRYGLKANIAGLSYLTDSTVKENTREMAYSLIVKRRWGGKMVYQDVSQDLTSNRKLDGSWLDTVSDFGNFLTSTFEDYLTGHAVQAAFYDGYNRLGLRGRELWEYASEGGAKTQSMYNYQDKPGMLRPQEVGALVPFQTFAFEVYNTVREMNIVPGVSKTGLYRELHAKERGGKPELKRRLIMFGRFTTALMVTNMIVDACIDRKPWGVSSFVPFLGYALGAAGIGDRAGQQPVPFQYVNDFYKGMIAFLKYGNWSRLRKWGIRYHAVGGVQLNRIIEGIIASVNEEVTDVRGKRMYPVTEGKLTAITMGPAKTAAGKEYYDKHYPSTVDKVLEYFNEKSDKRTYRSKRTSQRRTERSKRTQQRSKRTQQRR